MVEKYRHRPFVVARRHQPVAKRGQRVVIEVKLRLIENGQRADSARHVAGLAGLGCQAHARGFG
ncbi:hypothetical protein [Accumulibacter sp.]|uniref:hypothetical protein n=1 Tax=Accumulibacter sp. TaxID=2053492 RepID=UPI002878C265|nr:hypothetical protein [Accumulibacter sp.]MDS4056427.1 hypothetical protein [Accumulibacter sp.]